MTPSIDDLLGRAHEGDRDALRDLLLRYHPAVRCLALAGTLATEAAQEANRAALTRLATALPAAERPNRLLPIVEEVTRDEVGKVLAHRGDRPSQMMSLDAEAARRNSGPNISLPELLEGVEPDRAAWMLLEAAAWIPPHHETLFLLHYAEGMPPEEIAALASSPVDRINTDLDAARRLYERELGFYARKRAST